MPSALVRRVLTCLTMLLPVWAMAQTAPLPLASDFREGEQWTWRRVDKLTNLEVRTFWRRRVNSEGARIFLNSDNHRFTISQGLGAWAREWPLEVGRTWTFVTDSRQTAGAGTTVANAKVVGFDSVTVPAGTFVALKIEYKGNWNIRDARGMQWAGPVTEIFWYCPELKADIKREHLSYGRYGSEHWVEELIAYDPAIQ